MRLCDSDIEWWINKKKLIILPAPSIECIHGATVDIHLGNKFRIFNSYNYHHIDLSNLKKIKKILNNQISKEIIIEKNNTFCLYPKELILAVTLESIKLPNKLIGWLDGKSCLARLGLMIHVTSHRIDPGWNGCIVLECYNIGKYPLKLRPGMMIGALSFELLSNPSIRSYNLRKYSKYKNQKNTNF